MGTNPQASESKIGVMDTPYFRRFAPSPALAPYLEWYWVLRMPIGAPLPPQHMPADGRVELMIRLASASRRIATQDDTHCDVTAPSFLVGARRQGYVLEHGAAPHYVTVRFKPGGIAAFSAVPSAELTDLHIELAQVWHPVLVRDLEMQLAAAPSPTEQIRLLEAILLKHVAPPPHLARLLHAAERLQTPSTLSISHLADEVSLSQKHFERLFMRYIGVRPRFFARLTRFQYAMYHGVQTHRRLSLSQLAVSAGYYDQAHFTREFKEFTGSTPTDFFSTPHDFVRLTAPD